MTKRLLDIALASALLVLTAPIILAAMFAVYRQDGRRPFYSPWRVGRGGVPFRMYKLRTMVVGADSSQVDTTQADDPRITRLGHFLRRYKIDELPQLWNVLLGDMSLVGPRPQIGREVDLYTEVERGMLLVRPGITDFASIIFSDLGEIVAEVPDANLAYNQLVRPWKSRLALFYIEHISVPMDLMIMGLTALAMFSKPTARRSIVWLLARGGASSELQAVCTGNTPLTPTPPPGSDVVVMSRAVGER